MSTIVPQCRSCGKDVSVFNFTRECSECWEKRMMPRETKKSSFACWCPCACPVHNQPKEESWGEEFDYNFVNSNGNLNVYDKLEIKQFISNTLQVERKKAVAEHDAKWHPINDKMEMENLHYVQIALQAQRKRIREVIEGMEKEQVEKISEHT